MPIIDRTSPRWITGVATFSVVATLAIGLAFGWVVKEVFALLTGNAQESVSLWIAATTVCIILSADKLVEFFHTAFVTKYDRD